MFLENNTKKYKIQYVTNSLPFLVSVKVTL